tara:strand:- start:381 stop:530 length:150 start_codon:yes stop_codon:yes gene_type:complete
METIVTNRTVLEGKMDNGNLVEIEEYQNTVVRRERTKDGKLVEIRIHYK